MEDIIRRSDAINLAIKLASSKWKESYIQKAFKDIPAVEPKHGEWEEVPYKRQGHEEVVIDGTSWRCTSCGNAEKRNEPDMDYCPNCGAEMTEAQG